MTKAQPRQPKRKPAPGQSKPSHPRPVTLLGTSPLPSAPLSALLSPTPSADGTNFGDIDDLHTLSILRWRDQALKVLQRYYSLGQLAGTERGTDLPIMRLHPVSPPQPEHLAAAHHYTFYFPSSTDAAPRLNPGIVAKAMRHWLGILCAANQWQLDQGRDARVWQFAKDAYLAARKEQDSLHSAAALRGSQNASRMNRRAHADKQTIQQLADTGLSQKQIAQQMDVSISTVSRTLKAQRQERQGR